jgi:hypothetical protein
MIGRYKIQYFKNRQLVESDWIDINVPITEEKIVSVWLQEEISKEDCDKFMKQFSNDLSVVDMR